MKSRTQALDEPALAPRFTGQGLAGGFWRGAMAALAACGVLVVGYIAMVMAGVGFPLPLVALGVAWLFGVVSLVLWSASVVVAALGRGRLARPIIALGAAVFLCGAAFSALSLGMTSEPLLVGVAAAACLAGVAASGFAWRRTRSTASSP